MFTGIVEALGAIAGCEPRDGDLRLRVETRVLDLSDLAEGDSIAVAGVCLTVLAPSANGFSADVSRETLARTTLGALGIGAAVNLERALRFGDRLGGHLVSGHVDGLGRVLGIDEDARSQRWTFRAPEELMRYIAAKGSIAIDGTSLTVNEVTGTAFGVNLIPHTLAATTFARRRIGDAVNLEVDLVARYIVQAMVHDRRTR
jgi:riboflavin synthase